jgi:hypothetical protein
MVCFGLRIDSLFIEIISLLRVGCRGDITSVKRGHLIQTLASEGHAFWQCATSQFALGINELQTSRSLTRKIYEIAVDESDIT